MGEMMDAEIWQVEVGGTIYEAEFSELGEWIAEGSLQPEDKVRKGSLRWAKAQNVPALGRAFDAKAKGLPLPAFTSTATPKINPAEPDRTRLRTEPDTSGETSGEALKTPAPAHSVNRISNPNSCAKHPDLASAYICNSCESGLCKACPNAYGSVRTCPLCGSMCRSAEEVMAAANAAIEEKGNIAPGGFGFGDFRSALAFPFRFKTSLVIGAVMFMFFTIGQSAGAIGGIFLAAAGLVCFLLANMLSFGVLANTITNFSQGRLGSNFMPDFENFSIWEDVLHPFFLSIGVYITSFGPLIVVMIAGVYMAFSAIATQMETYQAQIERVPGTHYYAPDRTLEQSSEVQKLLGKNAEKAKERVAFQTEIAAGDPTAAMPTEEQEIAELMKIVEESRRSQVESITGKTDQQRGVENAQIMSAMLNVAAPVVVLGGLALLWALFYFPAACAVAGYTRSFFAVLNPLVGLDTIKRLGGSYFLILIMGLGLLSMSTIVSLIAAAVFYPFDLPGFGNIPARMVMSLFAFYVTVVFSCILGYALYKNADKLHLIR